MFFIRKKKKIAAAAAENSAAFAKIMESIAGKIVKIEKISDAGERYLALIDIEKKIQGQMTQSARKANKQVQELLVNPRKKAATVASAGTLGAGIALSATAATVLTGGAAPLIFLAGFLMLPAAGVVGLTIENTSTKNKGNPIAKTKEDFCSGMAGFLKQTAHQKEAILRDEFSALLASSCIEKLCDRAPEVQTAFARAAIKDRVFSPPVKLGKSLPPPLKP